MITKESIVSLLGRNSALLYGTSIAVSLGAGAALGSILTKRKLEEKWIDRENDLAEEIRTHYAKLYKRDEYTSVLDQKVSGVEDIINENQYTFPMVMNEPVDEEPLASPEKIAEHLAEEEAKNVFDTRHVFEDHPYNDENFNYNEELDGRDPDRPYVLAQEEYFQNETDFNQNDLSWFEGDGVLCDDKDSIIQDVDMFVGLDNMKRFGHGSKDPRVVYIRNEKLSSDFEVNLHEGSYSREVLGFIEHQDKPVIGKFRNRSDDYDRSSR